MLEDTNNYVPELNPLDNTQPIRIGVTNGGGAQNYDGLIDDVVIAPGCEVHAEA